MEGINANGIFDTFGLIKSIIVDLDRLEVKGVANMKIIFDSIGKLSALQEGLEKERKEREEGNGNTNN